MPRLIHQVPSYRLHRASGQAVVNLGGKDIYLGQHGTRESQTRYEQLIAQWLASHRHLSTPGGPEPATSLRKQYGLDAARAILGHSSPVVTEVYAELD
jgi:hypothetical protein